MRSLNKVLVTGLVALVLNLTSGFAQDTKPQETKTKQEISQQTIEDKLRSLKYRNGNNVFREEDISWYASIYTDFEYIEKMMDLKCINGDPLYSLGTILEFYYSGVEFESAKGLGSIGCDRESAYRHWDIKKIAEANVPSRYAIALAHIKDRNGKLIFNSNTIIDAWKMRMPINYAKKMATLVNKKGNSLFDGLDIIRFKDSGGTFEEAERFASIADKDGNPLYNGWYIGLFMQKGGTFEEAERFASIADKDGNPLYNGRDVWQFKKNGITLEEAERFSTIKDKNDNLIYGAEDICYFNGRGIPFDYVRDLSTITDEEDKRMFYGNDIVAFNKADIPSDYIVEMSKMGFKNLIFSADSIKLPVDYAKELFECDFDAGEIIVAHKNKLPVDYAKRLSSFKDSKGLLFRDGGHITAACTDSLDLDFVDSLAEFKDEEGNFLLSGRQIWGAYLNNISADFFRDVFAIKDDDGSIFFTGAEAYHFGVGKKKISELEKLKDMAKITSNGRRVFSDAILYSRYIDNGGTNKFAKKMMEVHPMFVDEKVITTFKMNCDDINYARYLAETLEDVNPDSIVQSITNELRDYRIIQLRDLTRGNLLEKSDKPNALVVFPLADWNGGIYNHSNKKLIKKIQEEYNTRVIVAQNENEVYCAIESDPNIELLMIQGHGSKTTLSLGEKDLRNNSDKDYNEKFTIDTTDHEFEEYLRRLPKNAVTFLYACSNGEGNNNLADFIISMTDGRTVYASKEPFANCNIRLNSIYPFDIKLRKWIFKDITYTNKEK